MHKDNKYNGIMNTASPKSELSKGNTIFYVLSHS